MRKKFLISVATAALISATGFASAQSPGNAPSTGGASQSAPSAAPNAPSGAGHSGTGQMNRGEMNRGETTGRGGSESGMKPEGGMRDSQTDQMRPGGKATGKNAPDQERGTTGRSTRDNEREPGKSTQDNMRQDQKGRSDSTMDRSKDGMKTEKNATDNNARSGTTTGQAASGAKLTTEQRTQVRDVITKENVRSVTNVDFSISVGTRVPRSVEFHPLPAQVVTIYPDWRGYEFFVVRDQIVVVNPRTLEIVAVLEA
ncbi:hypothetical protein V1291_005712 [Nitrobacteraceae bacterium AZCC 1564]